MLQPRAPSVARRLILSLAAGLFGVLLTTGTAAANEPAEWLLEADSPDLHQPPLLHVPPDDTDVDAPAAEPARPRPSATPTRTPAPTPTPTPTPERDPIGYDISYPQCGDDYPGSFDFAIVGVNGGRVYDINPCFGADGRDASQLAWAGRDAELYFNTGNPGPQVSRYWPDGDDEPRECETGTNPGRDTRECAFNYGWNAAEHAYEAALAAYVDLGWADADDERLPGEVTIWLDVEEANSWRGDRALNVAALEGAVAYLESVDTQRIGFYSTPRLWGRITGGTDAFADHPAWHAGARGRADAERRCAEEPAFTGGELAMVQWVEDDLDHNIRCADVDAG
jgi:hypothetical protein